MRAPTTTTTTLLSRVLSFQTMTTAWWGGAGWLIRAARKERKRKENPFFSIFVSHLSSAAVSRTPNVGVTIYASLVRETFCRATCRVVHAVEGRTPLRVTRITSLPVSQPARDAPTYAPQRRTQQTRGDDVRTFGHVDRRIRAKHSVTGPGRAEKNVYDGFLQILNRFTAFFYVHCLVRFADKLSSRFAYTTQQELTRHRRAITQAPNHPLPTYKLVVVGDGGVGKSAITIQFFQKMFVADYDPTIEDSYIQHTCVDEEFCVLDVLDTAGQEEFSAMREQYMRKGDGFMIVYSVTDPNSFKNVPNFFTQILRVKDRDEYPILLVANKVDLVHLRKISEDEGRAMASRLNLSYMETSAKDPPQNIDGAFHEVVRIIRNHPKETCEDRRRRRPKCLVM